MRILIIFIFLVSNSFANEVSGIKNLVISEEFKKHGDITFFDTKKNLINLNDYKGSLIILNFWATWCAPCKEEMPSLDFLAVNENLDNLKIFPINVGKDKIENAEKFFNDLNIKNLELYFDAPVTLAKKFSLRGLPTSIIFNKQGLEFAKIIGSIDFKDEKFIEWLSQYN